MKLYLVRHGESLANVEKIHQGENYNVGLSELGFEQVELISKKLEYFDFNSIYVSKLKRALQTAEIINKYHQNKLFIDKRLNEFDRGEYAGLKHENTTQLWNNLMGSWYEKRPPNGENYYDLIDRVRPCLDKIINLNQENNLIISHGGTMKSIIKILFPTLSFEEIRKKYLMNNTCLYEIELKKGENPKIKYLSGD